MQQQVINDYVNNHREKTQKLYEHIKETNQNIKEKIQERINISKEPLPEIPPEIYVKSVQKQSKTKNKYNKEKVSSVNKERKTAEIEARHHNTKSKIHLSKIKRPRKIKQFQKEISSSNLDKPSEIETNPYLNPVAGPFCSSTKSIPDQPK